MVIAPTVELPPRAPLTLQLTVWVLALVTVAANCFVVLIGTLAADGYGDGDDARLHRLPGIGVDNQGGDIDSLEIGAVDQAELVQVVVVPAPIGRAGDVPGGAVIGKHHAVLL